MTVEGKPRGNLSSPRGLMYVLIGVIVALVIIAGVGWGLEATKTVPETTQTMKEQVTALAYEHWQAIGTENVSQTASQYSASSVLYWYVEGSALNGTYTNLTAIQNTWVKFFEHDPIDYYSVYNFKVSISGNYANVTADLWYLLLLNQSDKQNLSGLTSIKGNNTVNSIVATLILPYLLTYEKSGGAWNPVGDWWGLPAPDEGFVEPGIVEQFYNLTERSGSSSSGGSGGGTGGY